MRKIYLLILMVLVTSCASLKTSSSKKPAPKTDSKNTRIEIIPSSPRDEEKIASPKVIDSDSAPLSSNEKLKSFGVFIDASGFDAFAAIGLLQELEKSGLKPVKIMGVGFGCYAALAWAAENNGNQAEWEALKFESWNFIAKGNLVGRIVRGNTREKFNEDVGKNFSKRNFSDFRLPVDCPVVGKKFPFALKSAEAMGGISDTLWTQLQIPSLSRDENFEKLEHFTGVLAGNVSDREWTELSKNLARDSDFGGWIYIKSRTSFDVIGDDNWSYALMGRLDKEARERGNRKVGNFGIYNVDLNQTQARNPETLMNAGERRKFLVEGRKRAAQHLPRIQTWLKN